MVMFIRMMLLPEPRCASAGKDVSDATLGGTLEIEEVLGESLLTGKIKE